MAEICLSGQIIEQIARLVTTFMPPTRRSGRARKGRTGGWSKSRARTALPAEKTMQGACFIQFTYVPVGVERHQEISVGRSNQVLDLSGLTVIPKGDRCQVLFNWNYFIVLSLTDGISWSCCTERFTSSQCARRWRCRNVQVSLQVLQVASRNANED